MKEGPYSLITWQGHQACIRFLKYLRNSRLYLFMLSLSLSYKHTHIYMHTRSFGMSSAHKCVIKSNIAQTLRCFLPPQKVKIKNIHAAQISGLASLPSFLQLTPIKSCLFYLFLSSPNTTSVVSFAPCVARLSFAFCCHFILI